MARITLAGTPTSLYRPKRSDLTGTDLRFSHFYYVNADGLDLTGYNLDWTDWIHCSAKNVKLPLGAPQLYSYRTDWTDAALPADFSNLNREFLVEALKQKARASPIADSDILLAGARHVTENMGGSWVTIVKALGAAGYSKEDVYRVGAAAFTKYPNAVQRWEQEYAVQRWRDTVFATPEPFLDVCAPRGGRIRIPRSLWPAAFQALWDTRDRWLIARRGETWLDANIPTGAPWKAHITSFDPVPVVRIEPYPQGELPFPQDLP